jgi:putative heme-binding domain-containing protein
VKGFCKYVRNFALLLGVPVLLAAQHGYTPADVEEGEQLFIENCAICHGPEGDAVPDVELARGNFRHASSDEELSQLIAKGIPGTAMPPGNFHEHQLTALVAYLRSMATVVDKSSITLGDTARGKTIFEGKGECLKCHRVDGKGSYVGPELTDIGVIRRAAQPERSIVDPDAEILPENRSFRVVMRDGTVVTGKLLNLDTFTIRMMDSSQQLRSFLKKNLKEFDFIEKSPMPSYRNKLSGEEVADLVAYLVTLKGVNRK